MSAVQPEEVATLARQAKKKNEFDTRSVKQEQKPTIKMPEIHEPFERDPEILVHEDELSMDHADRLMFFEEPVKILIHNSQDGLAARTTDYVANNGVAAEMLFKQGWVPIGYLPRGISIIVKRKIVSILAGARLESVRTNVIERDNANPENYIERTVTHPVAFSVIEDKNPRGGEWLARLLSYNV
jgi:hypothetical protein